MRPFREEDIPRVAELHRAVFRVAEAGSPGLSARYRRYFSEVFLSGAGRGDGVGSLVHEGERGAITGFLGAVPRRLELRGRPVVAALSSQFVVSPEGRAALVGVALLRAFLSGPQDVSIADEANATTRRLWEALGGSTAWLYSLHWTRALRPCRLALSVLRRRAGLAALSLAAEPVGRALDAAAARLRGSHFRQSRPRLSGEDATVQAYLAQRAGLTARAALRADARDPRLEWAVSRISGTGAARRVVLRDDRGETAGTYLYAPCRGGVGQVMDVAGTEASLGHVLEHLFHDAWQRGSLAVGGRLLPSLVQPLSDRVALFHRRGPWVLVHARRPEIAGAFARGEAFFSRMEGELALRFRTV